MADVTDATFATDVLERSNQLPVVVDLWAPWCGPCKTLGPILDRVIGETKGLVELAKVNVDENPQVSQAFQVQSIPAVYALRNGQVVDGFMGAQPEAEVVSFVQRLLDAEEPAADGDDESDEEDATLSEPGGGDDVEEVETLSATEVSAIESELEQLLAQVKADDAARERFLELLESLGTAHPSTNTYRRRLATALF